MDDQRDYAEEAYNRHTIHTGGNDDYDCGYEWCPYSSSSHDTSAVAAGSKSPGIGQ